MYIKSATPKAASDFSALFREIKTLFQGIQYGLSLTTAAVTVQNKLHF
jgi:hypothetical protein